MKQNYGSTESDTLIISSLTISGDDKSKSNLNDKAINDGKTSIFQTSMNMTKMCIGTGVLALPYATSEAGIIWYGLGLTMVALWNIYSTDRLLKSRECMNEYKRKNTPHSSARKQLFQSTSGDRVNFDEEVITDDKLPHDDENLGTFGQVALFAFGNLGLHFVDTLMMVLMFGIIIAYEGKEHA